MVAHIEAQISPFSVFPKQEKSPNGFSGPHRMAERETGIYFPRDPEPPKASSPPCSPVPGRCTSCWRPRGPAPWRGGAVPAQAAMASAPCPAPPLCAPGRCGKPEAPRVPSCVPVQLPPLPLHREMEGSIVPGKPCPKATQGTLWPCALHRETCVVPPLTQQF